MNRRELAYFWQEFMRAPEDREHVLTVQTNLINFLRPSYDGDISSIEAVAAFGEMLTAAVHQVAGVPA